MGSGKSETGAGRTGADAVDLRLPTVSDVLTFFDHQSEPGAANMAASEFRDRESFTAHWSALLANEQVVARTILYHGRIAGNIRSFPYDGRREIGYWLGQAFWGKGIASRALSAFLQIETARPLHAYVAKHNPASRRVLEKSGFRVIGEDQAFTQLAGVDVAGYVLELSDDNPDIRVKRE